jgi:mRNA interferase YafQ
MWLLEPLHVGRGAQPTAPEAGALPETGRYRATFQKSKSYQLLVLVSVIAKSEVLDERHRDHSLNGKWSGSRDCHIQPDWILIYRVEGDCLFLERTGSHSDLFR